MNIRNTPARGVSRRPQMPRPIRALVRSLPRVPSSAVIAAALNMTLRKRLPAQVLDRLADRPFTIVVRDMGLVMAFRCIGRRFIPVPCVAAADLSFRVDASDFAALAAPEDDPDTRFLHDLVVVGEPAIAAEVRRAIAGLDVARTRRVLRRAVRHVKRRHPKAGAATG